METTHIILAGLAAALVGLVAVLTQSSTNDEVAITQTTAHSDTSEISTSIPRFLTRSFPDTDFSNALPAVKGILSGGPGKDGIPALTDPKFVPVTEFTGSLDVEAIVLQAGGEVKVYPYNILNWHEIVNDTIGDEPVAVTFCPLCGSAITYQREIDGEETTFGVSGALIESNMVMYDRATESLWQQSTGEALAGTRVGTTLELFPMQLSTIGEIQTRYPEAVVLSQDTGHRRDYDRNPYSGYANDNNQFIFNLSKFSDALPAKEIMVVFRVEEQVVATIWNELENDEVQTHDIAGERIVLSKENGELTIATGTGGIIPFYFEMWFSVALQHGEELLVI